MKNIQLTEKQQSAFYEMKSGKNLFLTGPGGSGKSFLLKYFIDWYRSEKETEKEKIYVTSTTGLSSILIDGITINRYSGIGIGDRDVEYYYKKIIKMGNLRKRWNETALLIIDEISMMEADTFDKLEILARKIRKNDEPFGGIQLIVSGDFLQLPPVKSTEFCFESISWDMVIDHTFYFDKIIRQNDPILQNILNDVRIGNITPTVKEVLNSALNKELTNENGIIPTLLFSKKNMVIKHNNEELQKLINNGNENYSYTSYYEFSKNIKEESKEFYTELINSQYNVEDIVICAKNAQVMLTINMPEEGLANGSRGIIISFSKDKYPIVMFLNGKTIEIKPHSYTIDENKDIVTKVQIPLILSWAITIHKAQGMTLEFLRTDIGNSIFEYGQAYVVLSRIKDLNGLSLINIDYSKIKAHPKIISYYEDLEK